MKKMQVHTWGGEIVDVWLRLAEYSSNGNIALSLWCDDGPFSMMSVNIEDLPDNHVALDINNFPEGITLMQKYKLGKRTDEELFSGFCIYPVYELNMNEVMKYVEEEK